jgi:hypothetical protein
MQSIIATIFATERLKFLFKINAKTAMETNTAYTVNATEIDT